MKQTLPQTKADGILQKILYHEFEIDSEKEKHLRKTLCCNRSDAAAAGIHLELGHSGVEFVTEKIVDFETHTTKIYLSREDALEMAHWFIDWLEEPKEKTETKN